MDLEQIKEFGKLEPGEMLVLVSKYPMTLDMQMRARDMQARFHQDFPQFHLMIVDGSVFDVKSAMPGDRL
jgi:hypothetical protein